MRLFAERGIADVSVRDIGEAAEVSSSLVIHHYKSKEGLKAAVDERATAWVVDRLAIIKDGRIVVTDTVEGLRRPAPRTIEFRFARPVDPARFAALDGVQVQGHEADRMVLSVTGPVAPLLRTAGELGALDVTARPADLDELFLTYHRGEPEGADHAS